MRLVLVLVALRCTLSLFVVYIIYATHVSHPAKNQRLMSTLINASQAEMRYGLARSTPRRWIKQCKLVADADGYFDESDFLVLFRKSKAWRLSRDNKAAAERQIAPELPMDQRNQATGEVLPPSLETISPPEQGSAEVSETSDKLRLTQALSWARLSEQKRKNAMAEGKLISRALVEKFVGRLGEIDNVEWRSLSARLTDDLMALCGSSDAEVSTRVTKRIDEEVFSVLESLKAAQHDFLASLPSEVR